MPEVRRPGGLPSERVAIALLLAGLLVATAFVGANRLTADPATHDGTGTARSSSALPPELSDWPEPVGPSVPGAGTTVTTGDEPPGAERTAVPACAPMARELPGVPGVVGPVDNPFDTGALDVRVELEGPDGVRRTIPAFVDRPYDRALVGGAEVLTPAGDERWAFRFRPPVPGAWRYRAVIGRPDGTSTTDWTGFSCATDPTGRGVLVVSPDDHRYLRWEDGTPFVPIGENLAWPDERGTFAYDTWLDRLAEHGANFIRVWMPDWGFGLESIDRQPDGTPGGSSLGNYRSRLDRAWQLDHVIEAANQRGIVVMITIQNHGPFSVWADGRWSDSAYNAANGGPLAEPSQFFTDATARSLFARRLRYLAARWGASPNIVWQLWNEVDLTEHGDLDGVVSWHAEMGNVLRRLDHGHHLISTSVCCDALQGLARGEDGWAALWQLDQIDVIDLHPYSSSENPMDFTHTFPLVAERAAVYDKPVLIGETGTDFRGPAETLAGDPELRGITELLWAGVFAPTVGTGMGWWWDGLFDGRDQYHRFDGVHALLDGVAPDREAFRTDGVVAAAEGASLTTLALRGRRTTLAWIRVRGDQWSRPGPPPVSPGTVRLDGLEDGTWQARWIDPDTGAVADGGEVVVDGGRASLALPGFARDIGLRLDRR